MSVAIVAYNSAPYIEEALESVAQQTYGCIELVVSDDGSADDTVARCAAWMERHKDRFASATLLTHPHNTGTSANYNRAVAACKGEWCIIFDGDDALLPAAVEHYVQYVQAHPEARFVCAGGEAFGSTAAMRRHYEEEVFDRRFFSLPAREQYRELLLDSNHIASGTCFFHLPTWHALGLTHDERVPLLEDWPKWINIMRRGGRFHYMDEATLRYRLRADSVSVNPTPSEAYLRSGYNFLIHYQFWPRFWHRPSLGLLFKYMEAHAHTDTRWTLWGACYRLNRKLKHRS